MIVLGDALCLCNIQVLLWNFNLLKSFRKTRNQAVMITTLMNQESQCCCQTSCLWLDNGQCVSVCAQNVSGMVSESSPGLKEPVIGVREVSRHPPTQPKPDVCTCSQSILLRSHSLSPAQDRFGAARGAACGESGERGGNDWRLTGGRTGRVWRETFGSNKSIRALFSSQSESGSAATVSLGYWRVKSAQTLYTYQLQLTLAPRSLKYVQHRKAASASFGGSFIRGSQDSLKYNTKVM